MLPSDRLKAARQRQSQRQRVAGRLLDGTLVRNLEDRRMPGAPLINGAERVFGIYSYSRPTANKFVNGTYRTNLPNQYVYGYVLISRARQKYGDYFWAKVEANAAKSPYPTRFYDSFENISGQEFSKFYEETFAELKALWSQDQVGGNRA